MKLTREKCMRDKNRMKGLAFKSCEGKQENINEVNDCSNSLEQLIKEHFDNPPLKFEELEEDMWIWDNEEKIYCKIDEVLSFDKLSVDYHYEGVLEFEENRFYRKELKND